MSPAQRPDILAMLDAHYLPQHHYGAVESNFARGTIPPRILMADEVAGEPARVVAVHLMCQAVNFAFRRYPNVSKPFVCILDNDPSTAWITRFQPSDRSPHEHCIAVSSQFFSALIDIAYRFVVCQPMVTAFSWPQEIGLVTIESARSFQIENGWRDVPAAPSHVPLAHAFAATALLAVVFHETSHMLRGHLRLIGTISEQEHQRRSLSESDVQAMELEADFGATREMLDFVVAKLGKSDLFTPVATDTASAIRLAMAGQCIAFVLGGLTVVPNPAAFGRATTHPPVKFRANSQLAYAAGLVAERHGSIDSTEILFSTLSAVFESMMLLVPIPTDLPTYKANLALELGAEDVLTETLRKGLARIRDRLCELADDDGILIL